MLAGLEFIEANFRIVLQKVTDGIQNLGKRFNFTSNVLLHLVHIKTLHSKID